MWLGRDGTPALLSQLCYHEAQYLWAVRGRAYLYDGLGIQAEVEITKDKVGNFLESLVDDSRRKKGHRGW